MTTNAEPGSQNSNEQKPNGGIAISAGERQSSSKLLTPVTDGGKRLK